MEKQVEQVEYLTLGVALDILYDKFNQKVELTVEEFMQNYIYG